MQTQVPGWARSRVSRWCSWCSLALWSQLTIGWQWSQSSQAGARIATAVLTVLIPVLLGLGLVAAAPVMVAVARMVRAGRGRDLWFSLVLAVCGVTVLIAGSVVFDHGWPRTGGHVWAGRGLMPGGAASVLWAATISISSYWAHSTRLGAFPAIEIAWMALAPVAIGCFAVGGARVIRRIELSPRALRFGRPLAMIAAGVMLVVVAAAGLWVLGRDGGPRRVFVTGALNARELAVMAVAVSAALWIARRGARVAR